MRFRFTLTHRGSEPRPLALPALSLWDTQVGADTEWSTGPVPSVTLPGVTFGGDLSEFLYVDYAFEAGISYSITVSYTKTYLSGSMNPRTIRLHILDSSFVDEFIEVESTPVSPGGTGSVTLTFTATADCDKIAIKVSDGSEVTFSIDEISGTSVDPNDEERVLEINEPDGWKDAVLRLQRDKDFRSLIEFFEGSFIFYGDNGVVNGGIHFIKSLEEEFGPDVTIEILIELTVDDIEFETVFTGQLDLSLAEEMMDNKMRIPIIRDNLWAKFNNRRETPVDLHAATDLDGNAIAEDTEDIEMIFPSQPITYYGDYNALYSITYPAINDSTDLTSLVLAWDEIITDDLKLFTLVRDTITNEAARIIGNFEAPYDGEYTIELDFIMSIYEESPDAWTHVQILDGFDIYPALNFYRNGIAIASYEYLSSPEVTLLDDGTDSGLQFIVNLSTTLVRGDQIAITLEWLINPSSEVIALNPTIFGIVPLSWKTDCLLATTGAVTLSGEQTIDGVLTSGDRVLVKDQGNTWENGIYVTSAGAWSRAADMDSGDEFFNAAVFITSGDFQSGIAYRQTEDVGSVGVDAVLWQITDPSDERTRSFPFDVENNYLRITAKTRFRQTQQPAMLLHDAAAAVLKSYGLGVDNPFYSELLGSSLTNARQYDQDGCAWRYALIRGLQVRGYTLAAKPFPLSFDEWWKGANPILNLGLSYDFLPGYTIDPNESAIQDLIDWDDAAGPFPGASWNYVLFGRPFVSVNGDGGVEGYTCGTMATTGGQSYVITVVTEIFESGLNTPNIDLIFAILDASYNELITETFNYSSDGFKVETFILSPPSDGTYFALRVVNNTVSDTKSLVLRLAVGDSVDQVLLNEEFSSALAWTNEGAGTAWAIGGGEAAVTLAAGSSTALTQEFVGGVVGEYYFISEFTSTNFGGGETADLTLNFYDSGDNLVSTKTELVFTNETQPLDWQFTSLVVVTKVEIILTITAGADVDMVIPYAAIFNIVATEVIVVPDEDVIRVEEVEHFYDPDPSLNISNVRDIMRKYDNDKIYNKINIGYTTWKSEEISGIDDTQTQHIYATRFEKIGQTITLWSDFIASSLSIETTRRQTIAESTDYKFDDSVFIIAINPDDVSPDVYRPELAENFTDIENLLDPESRYNTRLSVARNFLRWKKWFNGCLQNFTNSFYKFVRGEGNFDMVSTMVVGSPDDCLDDSFDAMPLSEKQDIQVTDEFVHLPNYYEMEVPLDWEDYKTIRDNRKRAIAISLTDTNHVPLFIDVLDYHIMHGRATISGWTTEYLELVVPEGTVPTQECKPSTECENPITDELEEILTDAFGVCITE